MVVVDHRRSRDVLKHQRNKSALAKSAVSKVKQTYLFAETSLHANYTRQPAPSSVLALMEDQDPSAKDNLRLKEQESTQKSSSHVPKRLMEAFGAHTPVLGISTPGLYI